MAATQSKRAGATRRPLAPILSYTYRRWRRQHLGARVRRTLAFRNTLALVLVFLFGLLAPASASKDSKLLAARGLVEFNAHRYSEALELFDRAIAADPSDSDALYYRASTQAKLGRYDAAVEDLRRVVAIRPDLPQVNLDLGVALVETGQYREAISWLEKAQQNEDSAARASMFLGLAQLRLGEREAATQNFERAAQDPELQLSARYYLGVTAYQRGQWTEAEDHFTYVAEQSPDTAVGTEAERFLEKLGIRVTRNYSLYGSTGFQYDSNVILAPGGAAGEAQDILGVSQKSDGRAVFNLGGNYVPWRNRTAELSLGYDFFQSLHFELNEFNIQDHGPSAQVSARFGRFRAGLLGRYDYYLLETDSFLQQVTAWPWASMQQGNFGRTDAYYRMRGRDYKKRRFAVRNAFNHLFGIQQLFYLGSPDRFATVGYEFSLEDPWIDDDLVDDEVFTKDEAESYGFTGHQISVGAGALLPLDLRTDLRFWYQHRRYASESREFDEDGERRNDNEYYVVLTVTKRVLEWLDVTAAFLGDINDSNSLPFDYDRYIASLTVRAHY